MHVTSGVGMNGQKNGTTVVPVNPAQQILGDMYVLKTLVVTKIGENPVLQDVLHVAVQ
tara:strand:+ start:525 stop:698 length:174 start_codon:yes stop_codon:yes gene_type:complete